MAFEFGFYNSINGDRKYNANHFGQIFDGVINDGVFAGIGDKLFVTPNGGMGILVGTGKAWFNHTWNLNTTKIPLTLSPSHVVLTRYDAVVLEVNETQDAYGRENSIKVIEGAAAANPQWPALVNTDYIHQYPLAYIQVPAGATEIIAANIDIKVGTPPCPFVTGILQTVDISGLFANWNSQFDVWFSNLQAQLTDNVVTNLQNQINNCLKRTDLATDADINAGTAGKVVQASQFVIGVNKNTYKVGDIILKNVDPFPPGVWTHMYGQYINPELYPQVWNQFSSSQFNRIFWGVCRQTNLDAINRVPSAIYWNWRPPFGICSILAPIAFVNPNDSSSVSGYKVTVYRQNPSTVGEGLNGTAWELGGPYENMFRIYNEPVESISMRSGSPGPFFDSSLDMYFRIQVQNKDVLLYLWETSQMDRNDNIIQRYVYSNRLPANGQNGIYVGSANWDVSLNTWLHYFFVFRYNELINTNYYIRIGVRDDAPWGNPVNFDYIRGDIFLPGYPGWTGTILHSAKQYDYSGQIVMVFLNKQYFNLSTLVTVENNSSASIGAIGILRGWDLSGVIAWREIVLRNYTGAALTFCTSTLETASNSACKNQGTIMYGAGYGLTSIGLHISINGQLVYLNRVINLQNTAEMADQTIYFDFFPNRTVYGQSFIVPPSGASTRCKRTVIYKFYDHFYIVWEVRSIGTMIRDVTNLDSIDDSTTAWHDICRPYITDDAMAEKIGWVNNFAPLPYNLYDKEIVIFAMGACNYSDKCRLAWLAKWWTTVPYVNNINTLTITDFVYAALKLSD